MGISNLCDDIVFFQEQSLVLSSKYITRALQRVSDACSEEMHNTPNIQTFIRTWCFGTPPREFTVGGSEFGDGVFECIAIPARSWLCLCEIIL